MGQNILITGTDRQLILELSSAFNNAAIPHSHVAVLDSAEHSKNSIQLSSFASTLLEMNIKNMSPTLNRTIIICLRCPELSSLFSLEEEQVEKCFHTETLFAFDVLRKSLLLLNRNEAKIQETSSRLVMVYPQRKNNMFPAQELFIRMVEQSCHNLLLTNGSGSVAVSTVSFHKSVSFSTKITLLAMLLRFRLGLALSHAPLQKDVQETRMQKLLLGLYYKGIERLGSKKQFLRKHFTQNPLRRIFHKLQQ